MVAIGAPGNIEAVPKTWQRYWGSGYRLRMSLRTMHFVSVLYRTGTVGGHGLSGRKKVFTKDLETSKKSPTPFLYVKRNSDINTTVFLYAKRDSDINIRPFKTKHSDKRCIGQRQEATQRLGNNATDGLTSQPFMNPKPDCGQRNCEGLTLATLLFLMEEATTTCYRAAALRHRSGSGFQIHASRTNTCRRAWHE